MLTPGVVVHGSEAMRPYVSLRRHRPLLREERRRRVLHAGTR